MFLTASDFDVIPYNIPNLSTVPNTFPDYVGTMEKAALVKLMGRPFYTEFIDALAALPAEWVATNGTGYSIGNQVVYGVSVWQSLQNTNLNHVPVEGAYWTLLEADNVWLKLKKGADYDWATLTYKWEGMAALLKPFVYAAWVGDNYITLSASGPLIQLAENSTIVNPGAMICKAWNDYAERAGGTYGYEIVDTLYGFLIANETDYQNIVWCYPGFKNNFNI